MYPGNSSLVRPLAQPSSLCELSTKKGSKHSLYSWLPSGMNAEIYRNEACTLIDYTQSTISTCIRVFCTLFHVGYHTIMDHIQFDMMECVTT